MAKDYGKAVCACGKEFIKKRAWQVYCDKRCRWDQWDKLNPRVPAKKDTTKNA